MEHYDNSKDIFQLALELGDKAENVTISGETLEEKRAKFREVFYGTVSNDTRSKKDKSQSNFK